MSLATTVNCSGMPVRNKEFKALDKSGLDFANAFMTNAVLALSLTSNKRSVEANCLSGARNFDVLTSKAFL
jgi:hypothetical protein